MGKIFTMDNLKKTIFILSIPVLQIVGPRFIKVDRIDHEGLATGLLYIIYCGLWILGVAISAFIASKIIFKRFIYAFWGNIPLLLTAIPPVLFNLLN